MNDLSPILSLYKWSFTVPLYNVAYNNVLYNIVCCMLIEKIYFFLKILEHFLSYCVVKRTSTSLLPKHITFNEIDEQTELTLLRWKNIHSLRGSRFKIHGQNEIIIATEIDMSRRYLFQDRKYLQSNKKAGKSRDVARSAERYNRIKFSPALTFHDLAVSARNRQCHGR